MDLLVPLHNLLADCASATQAVPQGIAIRRTMAYEKAAVVGWVEAELRLSVAQAEGYTRPGRSRLLLMRGVSGGGKTVISKSLLERLGAIRLRSDVERKRLHAMAPTDRSGAALAAGIYTPEATARTYAHLQALAKTRLLAGFPGKVKGNWARLNSCQPCEMPPQRELFRTSEPWARQSNPNGQVIAHRMLEVLAEFFAVRFGECVIRPPLYHPSEQIGKIKYPEVEPVRVRPVYGISPAVSGQSLFCSASEKRDLIESLILARVRAYLLPG